MDTLLLDIDVWDLTLDAAGNIAVASEPYSLAQDAASAIKTFLGECYYNTTLGVPYDTQIFGQPLQLSLLKALLVDAAKTVPDVASAVCFITAFTERGVSGQVQVTSVTTGQTSAATFTTINPQGGG